MGIVGGAAELAALLADGNAKTVAVVRGPSAVSGAAAALIEARANAFPWRKAVWVQGDGVLSAQQQGWFGADNAVVAVVLSSTADGRKVKAQLRSDATRMAVENAMLAADAVKGP